MKQGLTDIIIIMDRSGSMYSCANSASKGINDFIKEQASMPGEARVTLVQFDNEVETVFLHAPAIDAPLVKLEPRGFTALNDAIGQTVRAHGLAYALTPEPMRPEHVVLVIVTDGGENSSKEYTTEQVKTILTHQQEKYSWKVTYLGANQDSFAVGASYGIDKRNVANYATGNIVGTFAAASHAVGNLRSARASDLLYSETTRQEMVK